MPPAVKTYDVIGVSPGIAIGRVLKIRRHDRYQKPDEIKIEADQLDAEIRRFHDALQSTKEQIVSLQETLRGELKAMDADIFDAHLLLVSDPKLIGDVEKMIRDKSVNAEYAVYFATEAYSQALESIHDEYLSERAGDIRDVASRVIDNLFDRDQIEIGADDKRIVVAAMLSPSETAGLDRNKVLGFAVESGSTTCHTAILARSMRLPAVVGIPELLDSTLTLNDIIIIDGSAGKLIINPDARTLEAYRLKAAAEGELFNALQKESALESETHDGFIIKLAANLESVDAVAAAKEAGAVGVGLFRTEFLFMNRHELPTEDEQFEVYKQMLVACEDKQVIVRTLDVGGDKMDSNIYRSNEENPFLGLRGIRLCLKERRDIFSIQLRALLRAGIYGNLKVMLPMVTSFIELKDTLELIDELKSQLDKESIEHVSRLSLGIMIETPAAAIIAEKFAPHVDFFSIGTNDLVQYTMAIDRGNDRVSYLYRPLHPAILELIRRTVEAAKKYNIWVSVCGQMAADPLFVPILVGLGVHELSMDSSSIGLVRRMVRGISLYEAEKLAHQALNCSTSLESVALSQEFLKKHIPDFVESSNL